MRKWTKRRRYVNETGTPDTYGYNVPGHNTFYDGLDGYGSENTLTCECGKRMYPDCDMSSVSINNCFNTHRLNAMTRRNYRRFVHFSQRKNGDKNEHHNPVEAVTPPTDVGS